jgi:large subunit ribosomal protein L25
MKRIDIQVATRTASGKGGARTLRRAGRVPAIIYGEGSDPIAISLDRKTIEKEMRSHGDSENVLVNVNVEGQDGEILALVRETQHDALTGTLKHMDFRRVSTDKAIKTMVPVHAIGVAKGVREGGVFEQQLREIEVECLPLNIPEAIDIDVDAIEIGQSLHVSDIPVNDDYEILTDVSRALMMVSVPKIDTTLDVVSEDEEGEEGEEGAEGEEAEGEKSEG